MVFKYSLFQAPIGNLLLVTDADNRVASLCFHGDEFGYVRRIRHYCGEGAAHEVEDGAHDRFHQDLTSYFSGKITAFDWPLAMSGSPFQQKVWSALQEIAYGQTVDYSTLAEMAGNPSAVRAAASACGANPVAVVVPCHRVIHKDGSISGYAGGVENKRLLLDLESVHVNQLEAA